MAGDLKHCAGCRDNYYNHDGKGFGGGKCWNLPTAQVVTRYRLHWWTMPGSPGAFTKVETNSCHSEPGQFAFYKELPDFVTAEERARIHAATPGGR